MTLDQVKELVREKGLEFFLCSFVEMNGANDLIVISGGVFVFTMPGAGFSKTFPTRLCSSDTKI